MNKVLLTAAAHVTLDSEWDPRGPLHTQFVGSGDGIAFNLSVKEKEIHGYTMEKLKENVHRMIADLRQNGHVIDAQVIETQMMRRVTSV